MRLVEIIKYIISLRRNPYLYFSGLLVTSGCILLSKGIFEILLNFVFSTILNNDRNISTDSYFSKILGTTLIFLGIILFYFKFLKKKPHTAEYINDSQVIKKIFTKITTLSRLDYFIDQALYPYLIESVLEEHESFENYIQSSYYHIYDDNLRELIYSFYISWGEVCQYWPSFTPTNVPDKLRPDTWLDLARTDDVEMAIKKVPEAAKRMHQALQELLRYIRNSFKDIGL